MTTINTTNKNFLKVYTNKNNDIFRKGTQLAINELNINGMYGIVYDDFNANKIIINTWKKEYPEMIIYYVATRGKTLNMDSKIDFYKKMNNSIYTPDTYLNFCDIPNDTSFDELFFVKSDGGTGSRGVNIYKYMDLSNINTKNCVIQKSMQNPDLYHGKRYKMRIHVILYNKNVYYCKNHWTSVSTINYDNSNNSELREMHVVYQKSDTLWIISDKLENYNLIENNIILALKDFKKFYLKEIENIIDKEFVILGFDFVVNSNMDVHIIEINHRSNYGHPKLISEKSDVLCIKDLIKLLVNKTSNDTDLILM